MDSNADVSHQSSKNEFFGTISIMLSMKRNIFQDLTPETSLYVNMLKTDFFVNSQPQSLAQDSYCPYIQVTWKVQ